MQVSYYAEQKSNIKIHYKLLIEFKFCNDSSVFVLILLWKTE